MELMVLHATITWTLRWTIFKLSAHIQQAERSTITGRLLQGPWAWGLCTCSSGATDARRIEALACLNTGRMTPPTERRPGQAWIFRAKLSQFLRRYMYFKSFQVGGCGTVLQPGPKRFFLSSIYL